MALLLDLAEAARKSGLKVVELENWKNNYSNGGFDPKGVLNHHTGSFDGIADPVDDLAYAKWLAYTGRSDLPPPLCNLALSAECVVYVCSSGNANHAGRAKASGPMPAASDGSVLYIGIEAMNSGSQGWGSKGKDASGREITQYEAYVRLNAALNKHYGWPATHDRGHKETSVTGKVDPGLIDMDKFRADIALKMKEPVVAKPDVKHVAFFNMGRDKNENRSSAPLDSAAIDRLLELVPDTNTAIFWCEIMEGDDNNELALIQRKLKGWTMYAGNPNRQVREPIFLSPDFEPARWHVKWVDGTGVPKWSPQRSILRVHLPGVDHSLVAWHNAAGPYTPQPRPAPVQEPLKKSWHLSQSAGQTAKRTIHEAHRHVTQFSDLNRVDPHKLRGEQEVVRQRTDHGYAYPAAGFESTWREGKSALGHIDSHRILTMHGGYRERG